MVPTGQRRKPHGRVVRTCPDSSGFHRGDARPPRRTAVFAADWVSLLSQASVPALSPPTSICPSRHLELISCTII